MGVSCGMRVFGVLFVNAVSLALVVGGIVWSGESPRVGVYVFYFNYVLRLVTFHFLYITHGLGGPAWRRVALAVTRRPYRDQPSHPVRHGDYSGPPAGTGAYLIVMIVTGFFAFMLMHAGPDKKLHISWPTVLHEAGWALALSPVGWLQDLWDRRITVNFRESIETNLGYNSSETTIAAVAVLTGGMLSVVFHTPWYLAGALLGFHHLFAVWEDLAKPPAAGDELPVIKD